MEMLKSVQIIIIREHVAQKCHVSMLDDTFLPVNRVYRYIAHPRSL